MKFYLISDNVDTKMGMRFAGIPGVVVHEEEEVRRELMQAMEREDIAVILMTESSCRSVRISSTTSSSTARSR